MGGLGLFHCEFEVLKILALMPANLKATSDQILVVLIGRAMVILMRSIENLDVTFRQAKR